MAQAPAVDGYNILLMNTGKDGTAASPAKKRQEAFKEIVNVTNPSIIFLQETSTNFLKIIRDLPQGYHGLASGESANVPGYIIDMNFQAENQDMLSVVDSLGVDFPVGRLRIVKLKSVGAPNMQLLAVSYHGPHKHKGKREFFEDLFKVLKAARGKFRGDKGQLLPMIIGGDFNFERSLWPDVEGFTYHYYDPSLRREGRVIDMFVTTDDLRLRGTKYVDMHFELQDGRTADEYLKHDPIETVLSTLAPVDAVGDLGDRMDRVVNVVD